MNLAFYVHIPYCIKRCGYCDFNTYTPGELKEGSDIAQVSNGYIDLLIQEAKIARAEVNTSVPIPTIFFGGGTPSLLPADDLGRVITAIKARNGLAPDCEITLEANPDSVTEEKLVRYLEVGFNRISFGMQTAKPHVLAALDRTHNPANVEKAITMARAAGFQSISVDLIYGTPGESLQDWQDTVEAALSLDIDHISAYALIVETGTKLAAQIKRGDLTMPNDDLMADMYLLVDQMCEAKGLTWYELSNWSKPGHQCRHNIAYWENKNWWGLGPEAAKRRILSCCGWCAGGQLKLILSMASIKGKLSLLLFESKAEPCRAETCSNVMFLRNKWTISQEPPLPTRRAG